MKPKNMKVKIDPYLHLRIFSVCYFLMAMGELLLVLISYKEHTATDWVIFIVFDIVLLWVSWILYRVCPIRVMTDGEKLYIKNTVTKETKEWLLSSFCAVYLVYDIRRVYYLIFSSHTMSFDEQKVLYQRMDQKRNPVMEHNLVFVRTDKFWKKLISEIQDKVPFYIQEDQPPLFKNENFSK